MIISQDVVIANLQFFNEVFNELSPNKKKELLRLLIKKIIFLGFENDESPENGNGGENGNGKNKRGEIEMSLWDLPPIGPSILTSASFAESEVWLPDRSTQRTNLGRTVAEIIPCFYRFNNKMKALCRGQKEESIPKDKILSQREWKSYLNQAKKKNPILEGYKYLECLQESPDSTYSTIAKKFNTSKARVCQMIALVIRLPKEIIDFLINQNEPESLSYFTERRLRPLTQIKNPELQKEKFEELIRAYHD